MYDKNMSDKKMPCAVDIPAILPYPVVVEHEFVDTHLKPSNRTAFEVAHHH
jgi:hypothetical protein